MLALRVHAIKPWRSISGLFRRPYIQALTSIIRVHGTLCSIPVSGLAPCFGPSFCSPNLGIDRYFASISHDMMRQISSYYPIPYLLAFFNFYLIKYVLNRVGSNLSE